MGFSPAAYSMIFDTINTYTDKKDIVRALKISTGKKKKYLELLFDISKKYNGKPIWIVYDLERFFGRKLDVLPFFRPEFFVGGYDFSGMGQGRARQQFEKDNQCHYEDETIMYVTACGLKKIILILSLGEKNERLIKNPLPVHHH